MSDIFISYKSEESERIQPLVKALEQRGWSVWWDRRIPVGRNFYDVIEEELEAANCVIVIWTKQSVRSDWVKIEASEGQSRRILTPVLLDKVTIPLAFRNIESAQLHDWDGASHHPELTNLLDAVTELCGRPIEKQDRPSEERAEVEPDSEEKSDRRTVTDQTGKQATTKDALGAYEAIRAAAQLPPDFLMAAYQSGDQTRIDDSIGRLDKPELVQTLQDPGLPANVRVSAGNALARIGDPRFRANAWYLPDEDLLGFVEIPAGPFTMGSDKDKDPAANEERETPQHELTLPGFYLARYPVTAAQFRAFVEASGHKPDNASSLSGLDNHPVLYVSWHDAIAYCNWLTKQLRNWQGTPEPLAGLLRREGQPWRVILPSEAEWEKAARGDDGRIYPWGPEFDPDLANTEEAGIGGASAVGCFPGGASPHGLLDMSGNVWEWTRSLWGEKAEPEYKYPYRAGDGREKLDAPDVVRRVLRGGAYYGEASLCRCSVRDGYYPNSLHWSFGFRVAASPFSTSGL